MDTQPDTPANDPKGALRIGVFICHCGSNIAGHLDCRAVTDDAATLPGVVFAKDNLYTCSEAGITEIQQAIADRGLTRVVVASCSPRTHLPIFQGSCARAGLNPYLFEMANIRDQCAWVHMGKRDLATEKAKDLVRMAVAKAVHLEAEKDIEAPLTPRVLVVGGGMAGLSAAELMSGMGLEVIVVEKEAALGGLLNRLHRLAPSGDLASGRIDGMVKDLHTRANVSVCLNSRVESVSGYIGNYGIFIRSDAGTLRQETVGCIVVATGGVPLVPAGLYGYDAKRVITQMALESMLAKGSIAAHRVVMIQCVGARSPQRPYCGRICCMTAVKNALAVREANPDVQVHILYRDMQMVGTEKEKMLWEARGKGVRFEVYNADRPPTVENGSVRFEHALMGEPRELPFDLLVLSTPIVAPKETVDLSRLLRVPVDQHHFFLEAHAKLRPLDFATDGIFVCGSARYPAFAAEARSQGFGVAARVATILFKEKLVTSGIVAKIDPEVCVGCLGCVDICPYGAIGFLPEKKICAVNTVLCKGCGGCAATCPSQSIQLKGFTPRQLSAQIRAACA